MSGRNADGADADSPDPHDPAPVLGVQDFTQAPSVPATIESERFAWWKRINPGKVLLFIATLYLFMLAIVLMKDGAVGMAPLIQNTLSISNATNSLGFGWLFAYLIMSGSPVAASALTFFDSGALDEISTYAMITGSRLGASFIVLFIGFLYVLRGRDRATNLSIGTLALTVTATTYLPSFVLGSYLLQSGALEKWTIQSGALLDAFVDRAIQPITNLLSGLFSEWVLFLVGLGIILLSFNLFDKCLPQMALKESQVGRISRLVYHPLVMFVLGAFITMISMSVSLSLSILVPLSNRGFIRRENVIPYIMGANITTFIDTLFAAALLENPAASTIVLAAMLSISAISLIILVTALRPYQRYMLGFIDRVTCSNRNMALFMAAIFIIPIILLGFA